MRSLSLFFALNCFLLSCSDEKGSSHGYMQNAQCMNFAPTNPSSFVLDTQVFGRGYVFDHPIAFVEEPLSEELEPAKRERIFWIAEQTGQILRVKEVADGSLQIQKILDLTKVLASNSIYLELGLLSFALDPNFIRNGYFYTYYTKKIDGFDYTLCRERGSIECKNIARLSRFQINLDKRDEVLSLETEKIILDIPKNNVIHSGGQIEFGPKDKMLYLSIGEDGNGKNSQDLDSLKGSIIRIDVSSVSNSSTYKIPNDNPKIRGRQTEIFAYGFRNPWRFSIDRFTDEIWEGDVGQNQIEEINFVKAGGNYGWPYYEGYLQASDAVGSIPKLSDLVNPAAQYDRRFGCCIIGGKVYRGKQIEELNGMYLFSDFCVTNLFAINSERQQAASYKGLMTLPARVSSFGEDLDGEIYFLPAGRQFPIHKLIKRSQENLAGAENLADKISIPTKLSETNCFNNDLSLIKTAYPYSVNLPFWSDGGDKSRAILPPKGKKIQLNESNQLDIPDETVFVKSFEIEGKKVETRLLVKDTEGDWFGYSYKWNAEQNEAFLVDAKGEDELLFNKQKWHFPGREECFRCHTSVAGRALGFTVPQLNKKIVNLHGQSIDQIEDLIRRGAVEGASAREWKKTETFQSEFHDLEGKAKAYLHTNCSFCHQPYGPGMGTADYRWSTPFKEMKICNRPPSMPKAIYPSNIKMLVPGHPESSAIYLRMHSEGEMRMPPVSSFRIDEEGSNLIRDWILSMKADDCP